MRRYQLPHTSDERTYVTNNPRRAAFHALARIYKERSYADMLIDRELSGGQLLGPDRGLYTELVYGVLRRQGTLDHVMAQFSKTAPAKLERAVLILLRLGIYQILFLDRVPVSAAVNETVKLAHDLAPRSAGFINAVLRTTDRQREQIGYPDPERDPVAYLVARYSHPAWLVRMWIEQLGSDEAAALARVMSEPAPVTIRANTLRISRSALQERLAIEGIETVPAAYAPDALQVVGHVACAATEGFRGGLFTIQDEASQLATLFLSPRPDEHVLDLCAAPGGKTTYCAQLMGNRGRIVAGDLHPRKLRLIEETAERLGIAIIETVSLDGTRPAQSLGERTFDRVLVDAPCSGLGVIRRNPEGKWWKSASDPARLAEGQRAILGAAAGMVRESGVLLYATCSTAIAENEEVVEDFLSRHPDFVVENLGALFPEQADLVTSAGFFRAWPHRHGMDGFFAARLRRQ